MPCSKRLPGVRDAFSVAFGVKNRLLRYGRDIRCQKQPPLVRDASSARDSGCKFEKRKEEDPGIPIVQYDEFSDKHLLWGYNISELFISLDMEPIIYAGIIYWKQLSSA